MLSTIQRVFLIWKKIHIIQILELNFQINIKDIQILKHQSKAVLWVLGRGDADS